MVCNLLNELHSGEKWWIWEFILNYLLYNHILKWMKSTSISHIIPDGRRKWCFCHARKLQIFLCFLQVPNEWQEAKMQRIHTRTCIFSGIVTLNSSSRWVFWNNVLVSLQFFSYHRRPDNCAYGSLVQGTLVLLPTLQIMIN